MGLPSAKFVKRSLGSWPLDFESRSQKRPRLLSMMPEPNSARRCLLGNERRSCLRAGRALLLARSHADKRPAQSMIPGSVPPSIRRNTYSEGHANEGCKRSEGSSAWSRTKTSHCYPASAYFKFHKNVEGKYVACLAFALPRQRYLILKVGSELFDERVRQIA